MKLRRKHIALLTIFALVLPCVGFGLWLQATLRQYERNRQLIAALTQDDVKWTLALIKQNADPNTRYLSAPTPSLLELVTQLFRRSRPVVNGSPTALMIDCGARWHGAKMDRQQQWNRPDDVQVAQAMLAHGAAIDAQDEHGMTALTWAIARRRADLVKLLLDHGANVNLTDDSGNAALMHAVCQELRPDVVQLLLAHGANANPKSKNFATPLSVAISRKDPDVVRLLLEHGADVSRTGDNRLAVLEAVNSCGALEQVPILLEHGADINAADARGQTALIAAIALHDAKLVRLLLARGANVNSRDNGGRTPIIFAVLCSAGPDMIRLLLAYGADTKAKDITGRTALAWAQLSGKGDDILHLLQ